MARLPKNLTITIDKLDRVKTQVADLAKQRVMVGIPQEKTDRQPDENETHTPITNAAIGYIAEHGAPEVSIPARPWLKPPIKANSDKIAMMLKSVAKKALDGDKNQIAQGLTTTGTYVVRLITQGIRAGIAPPLAASTLKKRARRGRKGAARELKRRAQGLAPSMDNAKPLIDTSQFLRNISFVLRKRL